LKRREFFKPVLGTAVFSAFPRAFASLSQTEAAQLTAHERNSMSEPKRNRPEIGMLLFPGLNFLDLIGPHTLLAHSANVHLIWKNLDLLTVDSGIAVKPTTSMENCPRDLDVLFVGGGPGLTDAMQDRAFLDFLADRGGRAKYVTSVCSGSMLLGAAGLLRGYKATSHWAFRDILPLFGAVPVHQRIVTDRNRITGGGVTAGIDFGLTLLSILFGENLAMSIQLANEYDPHPPFDAGTPEKAGPQIVTVHVPYLELVKRDGAETPRRWQETALPR
jgi:transcriptional regulator GlxA family with amidase domain